jgi:coproporphyrinogen III oxidase-like Fe-S oxidoreductase
MLSERIITAALRLLNTSYLAQRPTDAKSLPGSAPGRTYTLYAHVPFCERLCLYCSFNRFLFNEDRARAYFKRLRREMHMVADLGYDFPSLYIGGGTPTIMLDELCETIDLARSLNGITEVSSETFSASPSSFRVLWKHFCVRWTGLRSTVTAGPSSTPLSQWQASSTP